MQFEGREAAHLTLCERRENWTSPHESLVGTFRATSEGKKNMKHVFQQEVLYRNFKAATRADWIRVHGKLEGVQSE